MRQKIVMLVLLAALFLTGSLLAHEGPHEAEAKDDGSGPPLILGVLDFPNSGAAGAQDAFTRGILLLHSFEFDDARAAFIEAQDADPEFAMAIWGEAMTLNHPLWAQQDQQEALKVLARLAPVESRKVSDREQMYTDAVEILYGDGNKQARDFAYMEAMQNIYQAYPDDFEAATFYALSILGSVYERDFRAYMKAAAILEEVFAQQPMHPGAAHYLIHSYDDQVHAPLGLRAARVYAQIAPGASHAQHMVSHIYTSLGMWDEVVVANRTAVQVSEQAMQRAGKPVANRSKHALHWLEYALLQQGLFGEAGQTLLMMKQDLEEFQSQGQRLHYVLMRSSYIAEDPAGEMPLAPIDLADMSLDILAIDHFSSGFRYLSNGQAGKAPAELEALSTHIAGAKVTSVEEGLHEDDTATSEDAYLVSTIMARELQALLLYQSGDVTSALKVLETAAEEENARPLEYGPPYIPKPCSELLGEILLAQDRPAEAIRHFEDSLTRNTARSRSLLGLARAQQAAGEELAATQTWRLLEAAWKGSLVELKNSGYPYL